MTTPLTAGDPAPDFALPTNHGGDVAKLSGMLGEGPIVVYFYPKDDTPGCTIEAKDFDARLDDFEALGAKIVGISRDDTASHKAFCEKYNLTKLMLASDESGRACEDYGVWVEKNLYGKKSMGIQRATFLIDADGKIARVWAKVSVEGHADEVFNAAKALKEGRKAA